MHLDESDFKTSESLANLAKVADPETNTLRFAPCLRFYDKKTHKYVYYLQTNLDLNATSSATYQRIEAIGSTNSYLQYAAHLESLIPLKQISDIVDPETTPSEVLEDGGEEETLPPSNNEGFTPEEELNPPVKPKPLPIEDSLDNLFVKLADMVFDTPQAEGVRLAAHSAYKRDKGTALKVLLDAVADETDPKIIQLKNAIVEKAKKEGILVLNSEGEEQKPC